MTMKVRVWLSAIAVVLAAMCLSSCDHYVCSSGATFGGTCSSSGSGVSQGGTGTGATAAFAYQSNGGAIEELSLNPTAGTLLDTPGFVDPVTSTASGWNMVVAQDQYVYTAFPGVGQIYGFTVAASGTMTQIGSPVSAPYMVGSTLPGLEGMVTNPAGTLLFILNPDGPAVYVYTIGSGGTLTQAGSPTLLPFLPENMATDGLGKYLYVTSDSQDTSVTPAIAAYNIGSNGALSAVAGSPFSGTEFGMLEVVGDPSGKYLIGTTSTYDGDPHLYVYSIVDGAINPVVGSPFLTTYSPIAVAVQPSVGGDLVYSFSVSSQGVENPIEGYTLNLTSGTLTAIAGSPFTGTAGSWGQFDPSGAYLFALDGATTIMSVYTVGTTPALTAIPTASVGFLPGPWAVSDVP